MSLARRRGGIDFDSIQLALIMPLQQVSEWLESILPWRIALFLLIFTSWIERGLWSVHLPQLLSIQLTVIHGLLVVDDHWLALAKLGLKCIRFGSQEMIYEDVALCWLCGLLLFPSVNSSPVRVCHAGVLHVRENGIWRVLSNQIAASKPKIVAWLHVDILRLEHFYGVIDGFEIIIKRNFKALFQALPFSLDLVQLVLLWIESRHRFQLAVWRIFQRDAWPNVWRDWLRLCEAHGDEVLQPCFLLDPALVMVLGWFLDELLFAETVEGSSAYLFLKLLHQSWEIAPLFAAILFWGLEVF